MAKPAKPKSARRRLSPKEKARIAAIYDRFAAAVAEPRTELAYKTPFTLLVAVVLSAQATDKSVNKATERLYAVADTPEAIVKLGESGLTPFPHRLDRPLPHQGEERRAAVADPGRPVRRPGPA